MKSKRPDTAAPHSSRDLSPDLRRQELLAFLRSDEVAWSSDSHPELAKGTYARVRKLRLESDVRLERLKQKRDQLS